MFLNPGYTEGSPEELFKKKKKCRCVNHTSEQLILKWLLRQTNLGVTLEVARLFLTYRWGHWGPKRLRKLFKATAVKWKKQRAITSSACFQILVRFCVLSPQHLATCQLWQLWKVCVVMLVRVITNVPLTSWKGLIPHYVSFCLWRGEFQWKKTLLLRGFQGAPVWLSW